MLRRALLSALTVASLAAPAAAQSSWPLALSYVTPFATVSNTATIDIWVRLTNTGTTDFYFDGSDPANLFGLDPALLPADGYNAITGATEPFAQYTSAGQSIWQVCGGFFGAGCGAGAYVFSFNFNNNFWLSPTVSLAAGASQDFLFGAFTPVGGAAPPATYKAGSSGIALIFYGTNVFGESLEAYVDITSTCPSGDDTCRFIRDVQAQNVVPEPGTYVLLATGLAGVAMVARRRSRRS